MHFFMLAFTFHACTSWEVNLYWALSCKYLLLRSVGPVPQSCFGDFFICICNVNKFVGELGLRDARLEVFFRQVTRTCLPTLCLVQCDLLRPDLVYLHPGLLKSTPSLLFSQKFIGNCRRHEIWDICFSLSWNMIVPRTLPVSCHLFRF